jgi:hypothetical protein
MQIGNRWSLARALLFYDIKMGTTLKWQIPRQMRPETGQRGGLPQCALQARILALKQ